MKHLLEVLSIISFMLVLNLMAQAKEWRGIVPLRSTRADVERLLGPTIDDPGNKNNYVETYRAEEETVTILYSDGPLCNGYLLRGYRVPKDTVVRIIVRPVPFPFSDLELDKDKYKEHSGGHVLDLSYFTDEEEGVSYEVRWKAVPAGGERQGRVTSIEYGARAKDKHLECPEPLPAPNNGMHPTANSAALIRETCR
ncbi:MAG TPA: hypothetical protein VGW12_22030 [Pyrinomonadaceae bacterium]|nr:hypothetical protein [Pyrinomonadaceae bacterium]